MVAKVSNEHVESLLDATESVVASLGVTGLTLDAVAKMAGVSKGGLLHYFPSKDRLIDAVIERTVNRWRRSLEEAIGLEPEGPGRTARALVRLCLADVSTCAQQCRSSSTAMLSVLVHHGNRRTGLHEFYEELSRSVRTEGLLPGVGDVVLACVDGLWLHWITGLVPTDSDHIACLGERLRRLLTSRGAESEGLETRDPKWVVPSVDPREASCEVT
ncbi:MAG TPA: TetR/AcrR family transcriptional regulator [Pirellulaceae bacterium]